MPNISQRSQTRTVRLESEVKQQHQPFSSSSSKLTHPQPPFSLISKSYPKREGIHNLHLQHNHCPHRLACTTALINPNSTTLPRHKPPPPPPPPHTPPPPPRNGNRRPTRHLHGTTLFLFHPLDPLP